MMMMNTYMCPDMFYDWNKMEFATQPLDQIVCVHDAFWAFGLGNRPTL